MAEEGEEKTVQAGDMSHGKDETKDNGSMESKGEENVDIDVMDNTEDQRADPLLLPAGTLDGSSFGEMRVLAVEQVNDARKALGYKEVSLDVERSTLADARCVQLLAGTRDGLQPHEFYAFGSREPFPPHVIELVHALDEENIDLKSGVVDGYVKDGVRNLIGGDDATLLSSHITHLAVGIAMNNTALRLTILAITHILDVKAYHGLRISEDAQCKVRSLKVRLDLTQRKSCESWIPYLCEVHRRLPSGDKEKEEVSEKVFSAAIPSKGEDEPVFVCEMTFDSLTRGYYHPKIFCREKEDEEGVCTSGFVLEYDHDEDMTTENEDKVAVDLSDRDAIETEIGADALHDDTAKQKRDLYTEEEKRKEKEAEDHRKEEMAKEEEERAKAIREEYERQEGERQKYEMLINEASEEKKRLETENQRLQKQISAFLASLKTDTSKQNRPDESLSQKSPMELDRQYRDIFKSVNALKDDLLKTQEQYDSIAMDLQDRADEKQEKAADIRKTFVTFKRTIARAAENSRTRRKIPLSAIKQFEAAEATKDHETRRQRMVFIQLKSKLKKAEINLREKEQLADGLHLIDFEQLKIENQTLNEKIEERNEELHKLRKKKTTTVQVLTHIKEKLQFVEGEVDLLKDQLHGLDDQLTQRRDKLTGRKRDLTELNQENDRLRAEQGFSNNERLVQDFQQRSKDLKEMRLRLEALKNQHRSLRAATHKH